MKTTRPLFTENKSLHKSELTIFPGNSGWLLKGKNNLTLTDMDDIYVKVQQFCSQ